MECSPPGSSVHGIFQARVLEWVTISFSRGSSQPRDRTLVSHIASRYFTIWATMIEVKCLVDAMYFNQAKPIPSSPGSWKNCLAQNGSLILERLGTAVLEHSAHSIEDEDSPRWVVDPACFICLFPRCTVKTLTAGQDCPCVCMLPTSLSTLQVWPQQLRVKWRSLWGVKYLMKLCHCCSWYTSHVVVRLTISHGIWFFLYQNV